MQTQTLQLYKINSIGVIYLNVKHKTSSKQAEEKIQGTLGLVMTYLKQILFFEQFQVQNKVDVKYREFPYTPWSHTCTTSTIINILDQTGAFITVDEPTLAYYHSKPTVYISVHSWCCTFYGAGQMCDNMHAPYSIIQNISTALKIICAMCIFPLSILISCNY